MMRTRVPLGTRPWSMLWFVTACAPLAFVSACGSTTVPSPERDAGTDPFTVRDATVGNDDAGLDAGRRVPDAAVRDSGADDAGRDGGKSACDAVSSCVNGDGCCPTACHAGQDSDCIPVCGNGKREVPETCDGDCAKDCDDGIACTVNTRRGRSDTCDVVCEALPIEACVSGDRCCPPGCAGKDEDCGAVCGNAQREQGESCDGADCPTSCNDGNACTTDILKGAANTCSAVCAFVAIDACTSGDGCCPPGCAGKDEDCGAVCGNAKREQGESCDGADCPTFCNDSNACTTDSLNGAASACSAVCTFAAIHACNSGDGCCPSGCNANTDSDCGAVCGNGVKEGGETCDGNCPASCDDRKACTADALLGSPSQCSAVCSHTTIEACVSGDGCCAAGCASDKDSDCLTACGATGVDCTQRTIPSRSAPFCDGSACGYRCRPGTTERQGACLLDNGGRCTSDAECLNRCVSGTCAPFSSDGSPCDLQQDDDCEGEQICAFGVCRDADSLCGTLSGNVTLPAHAQVVVECDLHVPQGASLVLREGVRLWFAKGTRLTVDGSLVATGSEQSPVRFQSALASPNANDFQGLVMNAGASVELDHIEIAHAVTGIDVRGGDLALNHAEVHHCGFKGLELDSADATVADVHVHHCGTGLRSGGNALIERTELSENTTGAELFHWTDVAPTLRSLNIHHNDRGVAMDLFSLNCPTLEDSSFEQNQVAIFWSENKDCTFRRLRFSNNQRWNVQADGNRGATLTVADSWWATTDLVDIEKSIFDVDDNPDLGNVVATPFRIREDGPSSSPPSVQLAVVPQLGPAPFDTVLTATARPAQGQTISRYEWDFDGDGAADLAGPNASVQHRYLQPGSFRTRVWAIDGQGLRGSAEQLVVVTSSTSPIRLCGNLQGNLDIPVGKEVQVECDLHVPQGASLVLREGVRLWFAKGTRLTVDGSLVATGSEQDPVRFQSALASPNANDFQGLLMNAGASVELDHVEIAHAVTGIDVRGGDLALSHAEVHHCGFKGLELDSTDATVADVHVHHCGTGLRSGGNALIERTELSENTTGAELFHWTDVAPTLRSLNIHHNDRGVAMDLFSLNCPTLEDSSFEQNQVAIFWSENKDCTFRRLRFSNNQRWNVQADGNRGATLTVADSSWGSTDLVAIERTLLDVDDNPDLGNVAVVLGDVEPMCGNGQLETGETCDGNCPSFCSKPNACTSAVLTGSASACTAKCNFAPISACTSGDGCCAAGCTSANDNDCASPPASCGNGRIDSGEACDGNCPTSCSKPNACTSAVLTGSASACSATCNYAPISACISGDGCCPSSCTNANDNDCAPAEPRCGDGKVDAGETCDGNCPTTCTKPNACTNAVLVGDAKTCNATCRQAPITACLSLDGCCPASCTDVLDGDCPRTTPFAGGCNRKAQYGWCVLYTGAGYTKQGVLDNCAGGEYVTECPTQGLLGRCMQVEGLPNEVVTYYYTSSLKPEECVKAGGRWF